jgi:hypothetical protein
MTAAVSWEQMNSRYLAAALRWLRLVLERRADRMQPTESQPPNASGIPARGRKPAVSSTSATRDDAVAAAAGEMAQIANAMDPAPALVILGRKLGLSDFERTLLLLCAATEFDIAIAALCARALGDANLAHPTFALALSIADDPAWDALSPERPLRYWKLIEINQPGGQSLTTSALRADERIVNYIKGLNYLDDRLAPFVAAVDASGPRQLPPSQASIVGAIIQSWHRAMHGAQLPVVQLLGSDPGCKQVIASQVADEIGRRLFRLQPELLPAQPADLEILARLWHRESILLPVALFLDAHEVETQNPDAFAASIRRFLSRSEGMFFLSVREAWSRLGRESISMDVAKPTSDEQRSAWSAILPKSSNGLATALAGQFSLNLSEILDIAHAASGMPEEENSVADHVWDACRARVRPRLDSLAQRLDTKATWNDIVLPGEDLEMLHQIAAQVSHRGKVYGDWGFGRKMNRGLGISALFAGESGTGKTMAAEVVANELRLNLYRIDLSAVVSKYIGETEKNLRRLFDAAEDGGAILFFDEADALFGKRSEVKDSHDRYANIEVNYLLQRMEGYCGLAILATNMRSALDRAFTRRLRFILNFPFPGLDDRTLMWRKAFPLETPTRSLDYVRLARLNLTGGSIHSAALNAAFLAAQSATAVTMAHALAAAKAEFVKLERPINESDFRWLEQEEDVA